MNKLFSIVLTIAVVVLYYLHFASGGSNASPNADVKADSASKLKPIVQMPKQIKPNKIVYINSDVLNDKYEYVKDLIYQIQV